MEDAVNQHQHPIIVPHPHHAHLQPVHPSQPADTGGRGTFVAVLAILLAIGLGIYMEFRLQALEKDTVREDTAETLEERLEEHSESLASLEAQLKETTDRFVEVAEHLKALGVSDEADED